MSIFGLGKDKKNKDKNIKENKNIEEANNVRGKNKNFLSKNSITDFNEDFFDVHTKSNLTRNKTDIISNKNKLDAGFLVDSNNSESVNKVEERENKTEMDEILKEIFDDDFSIDSSKKDKNDNYKSPIAFDESKVNYDISDITDLADSDSDFFKEEKEGKSDPIVVDLKNVEESDLKVYTENINTVVPEKNNVIAEKATQIKEGKSKEFSEIMSLAISRPIEVAYDLKDRYIKGDFKRLDTQSTNEDLIDMVKTNVSTKYLDVSDCFYIDDFSILQRLTELEELDLSGCFNLKDLSFLNNLTSLRVLNLGCTGIEDLTDFPILPNLEVLNLKMNKFKRLGGVASCSNLHELVLWGCSSLETINVVENYNELRALDLDSCSLLRDIYSIANLKKLVYLNLNYTRIEDLTPIKNLINLEVFSMDFCPLALSAQNLYCFENLTKMKFLALNNRVIKDLTYFKNMINIVHLELSGNVIYDLLPIENMTDLQVLDLSRNSSLIDLSPLHKMKKLKKLKLNGAKSGKSVTVAMQIEDISVVKELVSLEVFESSFNKKIRNITPLKYCKNLQEVHFNDCFAISDITSLRFCKDLEEINFENCTQIRDLSFLKYLTQLKKINLSKTSAGRLLLSDLTRLSNIKDLKDGEGTLPIHKAIINSIKARSKISKIAKKTIKEEDNF